MNHPKSPSKLNRTRTGQTNPLDEPSDQEGAIRFSEEKCLGLSYYCDYGSNFGKPRKNRVKGQHYLINIRERKTQLQNNLV